MTLIIVRGLPGSGKTTLAYALVRSGLVLNHHEADQFFTDEDGAYNYLKSKIGKAHEWCIGCVEDSLKNGESCVVSNTFVRKREMKPYFELAERYGVDVQVITAQGPWKNEHDVPDEVITRMKQNWEN